MRADVFTLEVFRNMVSSVAEEMGLALHRTAFSPNIKERKDHSCAVFDPAGRLLAHERAGGLLPFKGQEPIEHHQGRDQERGE